MVGHHGDPQQKGVVNQTPLGSLKQLIVEYLGDS